jgi:hypothetical protein
MQVLREFKKVINGQLIINLPKDFDGKEVEIIILSVEDEKKEEKQSLSSLLLKGPEFSTGGKSVEDVKEEEVDITQDPIYQMEGYDSDAPADLSVNLDKYLYGEKEKE